MRSENVNMLRRFAKQKFSEFVFRGGLSSLSLSSPMNVNELYINLGFYTDAYGNPSVFSEGRAVLEEYIQTQDATIVIGNPGSGKSFFVKHLLANLDTEDELSVLRSRWPIYINAHRFISYSGENFFDFFCECVFEIIDRDGKKEKWLKSSILSGEVFLILEDIDELNSSGARVSELIRSIEDFSNMFLSFGNIMIVTSRYIGYSNVRLNLSKKQKECFLCGFSADDVIQYSIKWNNVINKKEYDNDRLLSFLSSSQYCQELSSNPSILSKLALLSITANEDSQISIIEDIIDDILMGSFDSRGKVLSHSFEKSDISLAVGRCSMIEISTNKIGFSVRDFITKFKRVCVESSHNSDRVNQAAILFYPFCAILTQIENDKISALFDTYRYYFAGYDLSDKLNKKKDGVNELIKLVESSDNFDYLKLTIFNAFYVLLNSRTEFSDIGELFSSFKFDDADLSSIVEGMIVSCYKGSINSSFVEKSLQSLSQTAFGRCKSTKLRLWAGMLLSEIRDPRSEVLNIQDMQFCTIEAGEYFHDATDKRVSKIDYQYYLSRFPITWAQFLPFVKSGAHEDIKYYPEKCADWFNDIESRTIPFLSASLIRDNYPVSAITWCEAIAYCRWLDELAHTNCWIPDNYQIVLPSEREWVKAARGGITVPKSVEYFCSLANFQTDIGTFRNLVPNINSKRKYSWSTDNSMPELSCGLFNINTPSTVGIFKQSMSPYGCEEMCGNVWEWTRTIWGTDWSVPSDIDVRDATDANESIHQIIMVKGGSFLVSDGKYHQEATKHLEIDYLTKNHIDVRHVSHGFRICIVPKEVINE